MCTCSIHLYRKMYNAVIGIIQLYRRGAYSGSHTPLPLRKQEVRESEGTHRVVSTSVQHTYTAHTTYFTNKRLLRVFFTCWCRVDL